MNKTRYDQYDALIGDGRAGEEATSFEGGVHVRTCRCTPYLTCVLETAGGGRFGGGAGAVEPAGVHCPQSAPGRAVRRPTAVAVGRRVWRTGAGVGWCRTPELV